MKSTTIVGILGVGAIIALVVYILANGAPKPATQAEKDRMMLDGIEGR